MNRSPLFREAFIFAFALLCLETSMAASAQPADKQQASRIEVQRNDDSGQMRVRIDGKEALVYRYGPEVDLPHYYPVRGPSGKPLTVQQTAPYPHHRSVWFADTLKLADGRKADFYNAFYSRADREDPKSPFRCRVRQAEFLPVRAAGSQAEISTKLVWELDQKTPVVDELRDLRVVAFDKGEYLLDLKFEVKASYDDVTFVSDAVHYAWPYVRMSPEFIRGDAARARITNSEGTASDGKVARWVDYSNTVAGVTEGLAMFSAPENEHPHRWLARDYGTFGPRRADGKSGKPFTLKKGESLKQRVGILVHSGDAGTGRVKERYQAYVEAKLVPKGTQ
jgi:hypothetical protein